MNTDYDTFLKEQFENLEINLIRHDTSPTGYPCYIEVKLNHKPKDMGETAKDLGNYVFRTTGLKYQLMPEYRGKGKSTTIRWFMSWEDIKPIVSNIWSAVEPESPLCNRTDILPIKFYSLIIQNKQRGVYARNT